MPALLTLSGTFTPEEMCDVLAYILATTPATSGVQWILGDVGMGEPAPLPFGYISLFNEQILWMTANGGRGGLAAGGVNGLDDWQDTVMLTVAFQKHNYVPPVIANPPVGGPTNQAQLGMSPPYMEQPGWRLPLQLVEQIKYVLRQNIVVQGAATTTRVVESRPVLITVQGAIYRAQRITLQAQRRQRRGGSLMPVAGPPKFTESRTIAWSGTVLVPSGPTGYIPPFFEPVDADVVKQLVAVRYQIRNGTSVTFTVFQNGVSIPGLTNLSATPSAMYTPPVVPANVADGDEFSIVVSAVNAGPDGLSVSLIFETTQQS